MAFSITPIPTPFLLNTIKLLDPTVEDLMTDKTTLNCPVCGESQQLRVRPFEHPRYFLCLHCHRAYDSVLLHHTVTDSKSLKDSLKVILQHKGLLGKSNKKTSAEILKQSKALMGYNAVVTRTLEKLKTNSWLKWFLNCLKRHHVYPGSKQSDIDAIRQTMLLWAKKDLGLKVDFGVEDKTPLYKRNRAWKYHNDFLVIPNWCPTGVSSYWFLGEMREDDITYYPTIGPSQKGGIAYLHETEGYEKVIASNNPRAVLYTQMQHYARFKRYAPIVLYSAWTTKKDWDLLGPKEVVFLGVESFGNPSVDCTKFNKETLQHALNVRNSSFSGVEAEDLLKEQDFKSLNYALRESRSTYDTFQMFARMREDRYGELKTLDYNRFLRYVAETRGQRTTELFKAFGERVEILPTVAIKNEVFEETPNGYRRYGRPEMLTNFTVKLKTAFLQRKAEEIHYELEVFVDGKLYTTRVVSARSMYSTEWIRDLRQHTLFNGGNRLLEAREGIADLLPDIIRAFSANNVKTIPVCENKISYDSEADMFLLPNTHIRGWDGVMKQTSFVASTHSSNSKVFRTPAFPWDHRGLEAREFEAAKRDMCPLIMEVVAYMALMLVAKRNKDIEIKPLLLERHQNTIEDLNRAIPVWPMFIERRRIRTFTEDRQCEFEGIASVLEVRGCEAFGAKGYGYVLDGQFPLLKPKKRRYKMLERIVSRYFRECIQLILREGYTTLQEISNKQYEVLAELKTKGGGFLPQKNAVLTEEQCRERIKEKQ